MLRTAESTSECVDIASSLVIEEAAARFFAASEDKEIGITMPISDLVDVSEVLALLPSRVSTKLAVAELGVQILDSVVRENAFLTDSDGNVLSSGRFLRVRVGVPAGEFGEVL